MTLDIIAFGAEGITVHPRPDGRHIRFDDVYAIANAIDVEFNIEGYPDDHYLALVKDVKPAQATLVPDPPQVLTSNAGWQIEANVDFLKKIIAQLHDSGIRTSLFIDPYQISEKEIHLLKQIGTDRVELYTEQYANTYGTPEGEKVLDQYQRIADAIHRQGIGLNAGHDLSLVNLRHFVTAIPTIAEVSIGHALICDALYLGMEETIKRYLACLN
jgi:pyridoxine 5-phosphate synthase